MAISSYPTVMQLVSYHFNFEFLYSHFLTHIGFGMHADFMNGWDQDVLEAAVAACHNKTGDIEDCSLFNLQTQAEAAECKMQIPEELRENVYGPMERLPGRHLLPGPGFDHLTNIHMDPMDGHNQPEYSIGETTSEQSVEQETPSSTTLLIPTQVSIFDGMEQVSTTAAPSLVEECMSYVVVSTDYKTEGNIIYEVVWEEAWVYVTVDATSTITVSTGMKTLRRERARRAHRHGKNKSARENL